MKKKARRQGFRMPDGLLVRERVCDDYVCAYCGAKASYCNYVGNICLQAFVPHQGACGAYVNDERYSGYINECGTCKYNRVDGTCELMEET